MKFQKTSNELWVVGCKSKCNGAFIPFSDTVTYRKSDSIQKFLKPIYGMNRNWNSFRKNGYSVEKVSLMFRNPKEETE